jgi:hypothetical protein
VAVSYCGLGEIFQHHKGGTERKRKKIWVKIVDPLSRTESRTSLQEAEETQCASEWCSVLNENSVQISRFWQRKDFVRWPMLKKVTTRFRQPYLFPFCVLSGELRTKSHQIVKRSFVKVANSKHTGRPLTQISRAEIKSRRSPTNTCCRSVQKLSSSCLITTKTGLWRSMILPDLYGYKTWSPSLRREHMLRISENRRKNLCIRRVEHVKTLEGGGEKCMQEIGVEVSR